MTDPLVLHEMLKPLRDGRVRRHGVLHWGSPVASFGDPETSLIATLGLNPSNREFVDVRGRELEGAERRFPTLRSLRLRRWAEAEPEHLVAIEVACRDYFRKNPYDAWFGRLNTLLQPTGASFYGDSARACHLDLVPYATSTKWGELDEEQRRALLGVGASTLAFLLRMSQVRLVVMNGASVVRALERAANVQFSSRKMRGWALPRRAMPVDGVAYWGTVSSIAGMAIGREIHVLGYNHNIQSSFGVTREVIAELGGWVGRRAGRVLR